MARLLMLANVLILCVNGAISSTFLLSETINSTNFYDKFTFKTSGKATARNDDNGSWVKYQNLTEAKRKNITSIRDDEVYLGVDHTNVLDHLLDEGRDTFRVESSLPYYQGLFIARFSHFPKPVCGSWPAFWTLGDYWPRGGEIDIYEGWNLDQHNKPAIHVGPQRDYGLCQLHEASQSSRILSYDCDNECKIPNKQWEYQGCQSEVKDGTWGSPEGGTQALLWTNQSIEIYSWKKGMEPSNIQLSVINTATWGRPAVHLRDCDITKAFGPQEIVINIALCGNPVDKPGIWDRSGDQGCLKIAGPDCRAYVAKNPSLFKDVYFQVKDIRYFKLSTQSQPPSDLPPLIRKKKSVDNPTANQQALLAATSSMPVNETKTSAGRTTAVAVTSPMSIVKPMDSLNVTKLESITGATSSKNQTTGSQRSISETATETTKTNLTTFSRPTRAASTFGSDPMPVTQPINTLPFKTTLASSSTSNHWNRTVPKSSSSIKEVIKATQLSYKGFQVSNAEKQYALPTSNLPLTTANAFPGLAAISSSQAGGTNQALASQDKQSGSSSGTASRIDFVTSGGRNQASVTWANTTSKVSITSSFTPVFSSESSIGSLKFSEVVDRVSDTRAQSRSYAADASSLAPPSMAESMTAETVDLEVAEQLMPLTIYSKSTSTITACPPTVTSCPLNSVTVVDVPWYTTTCPVTPVSTHAVQTPVISGDAPRYLIGTVVKVFSILRCPSTVPNCPLGSVGTTLVTETHSLARQTPGFEPPEIEPKAGDSGKGHPQRTRTLVIAHNPTTSGRPVLKHDIAARPVVEEPTLQPQADGENPSTSGKKGKSNFKATITRVITISSCAPTMTDCSIGKTTTQIIVETRCPSPGSSTPIEPLKFMPADSPLVGNSNQKSFDGVDIGPVPNLLASEAPRSRRTTEVLTITRCPPTVVDCSIGSLSTAVTVIPCSGPDCGLSTPTIQPPNQPKNPGLDREEPGDDPRPSESLDETPDFRYPAQSGSFKRPQRQAKNLSSLDNSSETHGFTKFQQPSDWKHRTGRLERPQRQIETSKSHDPLESAEPPVTDGHTAQTPRPYQPFRKHDAGPFKSSVAGSEDDLSPPGRESLKDEGDGFSQPGNDSQREEVVDDTLVDLKPSASQNPPTEIQQASEAIQRRAGFVAALGGVAFALL